MPDRTPRPAQRPRDRKGERSAEFESSRFLPSPNPPASPSVSTPVRGVPPYAPPELGSAAARRAADRCVDGRLHRRCRSGRSAPDAAGPMRAADASLDLYPIRQVNPFQIQLGGRGCRRWRGSRPAGGAGAGQRSRIGAAKEGSSPCTYSMGRIGAKQPRKAPRAVGMRRGRREHRRDERRFRRRITSMNLRPSSRPEMLRGQ